MQDSGVSRGKKNTQTKKRNEYKALWRNVFIFFSELCFFCLFFVCF